jgi:hypothetical protein
VGFYVGSQVQKYAFGDYLFGSWSCYHYGGKLWWIIVIISIVGGLQSFVAKYRGLFGWVCLTCGFSRSPMAY